MKRLFFLLAILLTVAIGTKVEAQTKLLDGVPVVLWDNTNAVDSVDADGQPNPPMPPDDEGDSQAEVLG